MNKLFDKGCCHVFDTLFVPLIDPEPILGDPIAPKPRSMQVEILANVITHRDPLYSMDFLDFRGRHILDISNTQARGIC